MIKKSKNFPGQEERRKDKERAKREKNKRKMCCRSKQVHVVAKEKEEKRKTEQKVGKGRFLPLRPRSNQMENISTRVVNHLGWTQPRHIAHFVYKHLRPALIARLFDISGNAIREQLKHTSCYVANTQIKVGFEL